LIRTIGSLLSKMTSVRLLPIVFEQAAFYDSGDPSHRS
jgi:hypothetical protein